MGRKARKVSQVSPSCPCPPYSPVQCCLLYWISMLSRAIPRIAAAFGEGWNRIGFLGYNARKMRRV